MERIKQTYLLWHEYHSTLPKIHRYTLGEKIDSLFIEIMEEVSAAAFLSRSEKSPHLAAASRKLSVVELLLMILWETKSLRDKRYMALATQLMQIGKTLNGWRGQLQKQNSSEQRG